MLSHMTVSDLQSQRKVNRLYYYYIKVFAGYVNNRFLYIQWNLRIKDTLGAAILSSVERLSSSWRLKTNYCYGKGVQKCVLYWEVVPFPEDPLLEVPLYLRVQWNP